MKVLKRNKQYADIDFNQILHRIKDLVDMAGLANEVDSIKVSQRVCSSLYDGVTTKELDDLSADIAVSLMTEHPSYAILASYITIDNLHKNTPDKFSDCMRLMYDANILADETMRTITENETKLDAYIKPQNDFLFDFFGMKTLMKSYLYKVNDEIVETPQYLLMRVAIGIHGNDIQSVLETYDLMSQKYFIHATPTLFNSGTRYPQLSSCYLVELEDDSIEGIFNTLKDCSQISKWAGGIGLHIHKLRSTGSDIRDNKGACTGIVPSLRVFNAMSRYVNQGGKRPGSIAIYLAVEHPDIFKMLELRKNHGDEEQRCRDLFYGIWISDLFMERVKSDGVWSLFCPNSLPCPLQDVYGEEYETLYKQYEKDELYVKQVKARELWIAICNSQIETGTPYMLYKDAINTKSNQQNVGVIKSSNLCCEITEYTSPDEIAVCNLASISLPKCVTEKDGTVCFDHEILHRITKVITKNLNRVIDVNMYPLKKAENSNKRHRPIGIGVQGLADVFMMLKQPFESEMSKRLNMDIFETIYHAALEASFEQSIIHGPYATFSSSPADKGKLQFDMWGEHAYKCGSNRYDWSLMKQNINAFGLRNSLLVAPMPTASTSQILGNNECFEPYTSNVYLRRTVAGEFIVLNKHLVNDLIKEKLWNPNMKDLIIAHNGSVQDIQNIPASIKELYKTAWEISQRTLINMASDRGMYVCQSQSLNLFVPRPTIKLLSSMHFHSWESGLKTGVYYLRTQPASSPIQFTINPDVCETCSA